ncbi:hypothetical protein KI387_024650, partial [Taxus chinensis]
PRVIWDEGNLEEIEANKPVRQKIIEPKTPYHPPEYEDGFISVSDEDKAVDAAAHAELIRVALSKVTNLKRQGSDWTSSGDEAEDMEQDEEVHDADGNKLSFEELRRLHYDEYRKVKQLHQKHPVENKHIEENGKQRSLKRSNHQQEPMEDALSRLEIFRG